MEVGEEEVLTVLVHVCILEVTRIQSSFTVDHSCLVMRTVSFVGSVWHGGGVGTNSVWCMEVFWR